MTPDRESPDSESPAGNSPDWLDASQSRSNPPHSEIALQMAVVEYARRPDRCTVYPPGLTSVELMSTWITADRATVESLAARR